jgi:hypothetical protein
MTQHTPGPWTVDVEDECRVIDVQDCTVARTDYVEIEEERDWQVANAALIAAAPAMLEALTDLMPLLDAVEASLGDDSDEDHLRIEQARAALAAAGRIRR